VRRKWGDARFSQGLFAAANEVCAEVDADPTGTVLSAYKDELTVEYAPQGISNQLFVTKHQSYLPDKETLRCQLGGLLAEEGNGGGAKGK